MKLQQRKATTASVIRKATARLESLQRSIDKSKAEKQAATMRKEQTAAEVNRLTAGIPQLQQRQAIQINSVQDDAARKSRQAQRHADRAVAAEAQDEEQLELAKQKLTAKKHVVQVVKANANKSEAHFNRKIADSSHQLKAVTQRVQSAKQHHKELASTVELTSRHRAAVNAAFATQKQARTKALQALNTAESHVRVRKEVGLKIESQKQQLVMLRTAMAADNTTQVTLTNAMQRAKEATKRAVLNRHAASDALKSSEAAADAAKEAEVAQRKEAADADSAVTEAWHSEQSIEQAAAEESKLEREAVSAQTESEKDGARTKLLREEKHAHKLATQLHVLEQQFVSADKASQESQKRLVHELTDSKDTLATARQQISVQITHAEVEATAHVQKLQRDAKAAGEQFVAQQRIIDENVQDAEENLRTVKERGAMQVEHAKKSAEAELAAVTFNANQEVQDDVLMQQQQGRRPKVLLSSS